MRPLRYAINVTLDGCVHHEAGVAPDEELMRFWTEQMENSDAELYGRVTFEMMREAWKRPDDGVWPNWMDAGEQEFADTLDRAKKYVVSSTLDEVDWNAELVGGDLGEAVRALKEQPGKGLSVGGLALSSALTDLGLIDEYLFVVHPIVAGHGPYLLEGLRERVSLELVERREFGSGATLMRYTPRS
ncbi:MULTISPECIES: dihydrofolate reductase family protein [unclassified Microbacterium]|uniref:dihydrofolate reductase family protein n=1 Tax=unclassified Microbacterium TaxID=2609290 RepID=UPI00343984FF